MSSCFVIQTSKPAPNNPIVNAMNIEGKPMTSKDKVMSYEEKSVGSTAFFQCEACPYMAFAEDDIKFHLFTEHPDLAKSNGLADNIQIPCPGCTSVFEAEETLRTHLRSHHKMGLKDVKKMVKSLVQIALKNAKLKKKETKSESLAETAVSSELTNVKMPPVIEIVPDIVNANSDLPKGVAFISVDELNKMSTPNFEKVDPKEIIQEASINIVYTNDVSTQYVKLADIDPSNAQCNMIQVSNVTPDLISSIQPHLTSDSAKLSPPKDNMEVTSQAEHTSTTSVNPEDKGTMCSVAGCHIRLKAETKLAYHRKCHQNGKFVCQECGRVMLSTQALHTHLWKVHEVDLELPTCEICGYKTYKRYRLVNVHMKSHKNILGYTCSICSKSFKNSNQLSKHKMIHKKDRLPVPCPICQLQFSSEGRMQSHVSSVHEKMKPFKCPECNYCTARSLELKRHSRLHTGDKPYSCDQCTYKTADHNALRRHKKWHSNEATYKCKYCPYTCIQSTVFTSHMISKHPNISGDIHRCPYCQFKTVNKDKYVIHLTTHADKEGIQLLIEMTKKNKANKPSWNIPSETVEKPANKCDTQDQNKEPSPKTVNSIPIEVYDCDSLSESLPQDYSKSYCTPSNSDGQPVDYNVQVMVRDLSKDDNNADCVISEDPNNSLMNRHQFPSQIPLPMNFEPNLHEYLNTNVSVEQTLLQNSNVNSLPTNESSIASSISNNIMSNFPIRLPHVPQISVCNSSTMLTSVDKISLPMIKVTGPIIKPTQILPVPSSSNSPVNNSNEQDGVPRKKPKISVKSNLILKGPDEENMFHSQQKMAFKRLEDNERFGLRNPVTFNNLITTQFMQLQPEPELSESPSDIMTYPQETMMSNPAATPEDSGMTSEPQIFTFNQQRNNPITLLPPPPKIQTNDPSYIKLETTIKQNTQSPSLERMCNANILNSQAMSREYKASPPLEDIHKNMSVIKNEVKPDSYYNIAMNNNAGNSPILDQYLIDNIIGEQYSGHLDLSAVVLPEVSEDDQQNDVIEIDDNSDDNKLLPRFDMNLLPLDSFYLMHNDFHFLENEVPANNMQNDVAVNEINRMVTEVPIVAQKDNSEGPHENSSGDFPNFIQGKKDPMMNTSVRVRTNKINVKNIELMKN
ncbi:zinc finger protein 236-like [Plodia interpunctella]|uniref:zinc finger protein 236-like n=1 Tax=Plodia interpunctella TaxID=58824 RepID=UPI002368A4BF|nr:zinc finger protein 236-like [Plodia interpunctella]